MEKVLAGGKVMYKIPGGPYNQKSFPETFVGEATEIASLDFPQNPIRMGTTLKCKHPEGWIYVWGCITAQGEAFAPNR
jgi:hypothetical protein